MHIEGKAFRGNKVYMLIDSERDEADLDFSKQLENCLLEITKALNVSPPLWMHKNTVEFARLHKTFFPAEQFMEKVNFDRLQITWLDDGR